MLDRALEAIPKRKHVKLISKVCGETNISASMLFAHNTVAVHVVDDGDDDELLSPQDDIH